ncbi:G1 family endopeptidase [Paenibacillus sp. N3/727]|uniref:G1 family glutamic endopeptidase n=1 Tax=Paenibacillus sp. N3/727 TaxID=2925845 RepID=UPI001F535B2D|nr:G1 family glutamic endopeptidase [Paenibacillus sp. N3/727]UNK17182.1 G1 family endopeptidase [Paenibacillus sp. N3/727]
MRIYSLLKQQRPCVIEQSDKTRRSLSWSSSNWSGFALSGKKGAYHRISAEWNVPFVRPTRYTSFSSAWIGIDGFQNSNLIQTGTGHDFVNGKSQYYAWWEILPATATIIAKPVHPGDRMKAIIVKRTFNKWLISLQNLTRNWTFRTIQRYTGPQTSAEWIVEAPQVGGVNTRLARLTPVAFTNYRVNGKIPRLTQADRIIMIQGNKIISIPTRSDQTGNTFVIRGS